ncbi:MAG: thiol-disulfide oxidoreductase DCC family protein, partial [Anaerolineae bacterium]
MKKDGLHLIFFDDACPLCCQSVGFILKWDAKKLFLFAPLSGSTAALELKEGNEELRNANTMVLIENFTTPRHRLWTRGRAVFRILWLMGGFWQFLGWMCFIPYASDILYRLIARH